jgi:SM-20-related protein
MNVSYKYQIEGHEVFVVDGCYSEAEIQSLYRFFLKTGNWHREYGDNDPQHWHLATDYPLEVVGKVDPFSKMESLVNELFTNEKQVPYRAYCNLTRFGDQCNAHRDCDEQKLDVTGLFYANAEWKINWGGETYFYNKAGDTVAAVNPKPGRIVLFKGAILHRNGVPCRAAQDSRLSVAYKFRNQK